MTPGHQKRKKKSSAEHKSDIDFASLLCMLQQVHDDELAASRQGLEAKLMAVQKDLLVARDLADKLQSRSNQEESGEEVQGLQHENVQSQGVQVELNLNSEDEKKCKEAEQTEDASAKNSITAYPDNPRAKYRASEWLHLFGFQHRERGRGSQIVNEEALPLWRKSLVNLVGWQSFDAACAIAIFSNSALLGAKSDYVARNMTHPADLPIAFKALELIYTVWFVIELLVRMLAYGLTFFYRHGWAWNIFDLFIVGTDALQTVLDLATEGKRMGASTVFRVLRVLRVTRALRVVRLVRFFRQLRIMVYSVMRCGTSLLWSLVFCVVIIYVFCIFLVNAVTDFLQEHLRDKYFEHYRDYWTSLPQGMWTLYSCMTGGVSWMEVGRPLFHIGWAYGVVLGFFMFFCIFVVTNVVTGIFVDTAIRSAQMDRDEVILEQLSDEDSSREQLKEVFAEADLDGSGTLTLDEFVEHLNDERVRAHLKAIGLHVEEAKMIFDLLDTNNSQELHVDEFLQGCMRLKGEAKTVDLATLMFENKRMMSRFKSMNTDIIKGIIRLNTKFDQLQTSGNKRDQRNAEKWNEGHQDAVCVNLVEPAANSGSLDPGGHAPNLVYM